jgi:hypothetical protein
MQEWIKHNDTGQQVHMPTAILVCDAMLGSLLMNAEEIDAEVFGNIMRDQPPTEVFEALVRGLKDTMEKVAEESAEAIERVRRSHRDIERVNNEDGS